MTAEVERDRVVTERRDPWREVVEHTAMVVRAVEEEHRCRRRITPAPQTQFRPIDGDELRAIRLTEGEGAVVVACERIRLMLGHGLSEAIASRPIPRAPATVPTYRPPTDLGECRFRSEPPAEHNRTPTTANTSINDSKARNVDRTSDDRIAHTQRRQHQPADAPASTGNLCTLKMAFVVCDARCCGCHEERASSPGAAGVRGMG